MLPRQKQFKGGPEENQRMQKDPSESQGRIRTVPGSERSALVQCHEEYLRSTTEKSPTVNYAGVEFEATAPDQLTVDAEEGDASVKLSFQRLFTSVKPQDNYIETVSSRSRQEGTGGTVGSDSAKKHQNLAFAHLGPGAGSKAANERSGGRDHRINSGSSFQESIQRIVPGAISNIVGQIGNYALYSALGTQPDSPGPGRIEQSASTRRQVAESFYHVEPLAAVAGELEAHKLEPLKRRNTMDETRMPERATRPRPSLEGQIPSLGPKLPGMQILKLKVRSQSNIISNDKGGSNASVQSPWEDFDVKTSPESPILSVRERQLEADKAHAKNHDMLQALTNYNEEVTLKTYEEGAERGSESDGFFSDSYEVGQKRRQPSTSPQKSDKQIRDSNCIPDGESDGEIKRLSNRDEDSDDSNVSISRLKL